MVAIQGFGGGLDVQSIVSQLMYVERTPVRTMESRITTNNEKVAAYRELESKLSALETAATSLTSIDTASAKSAVSSDSSVLSATATGEAVAGRYTIKVTQLASTNTWASGAFSSTTDNVGEVGQTITLKVGDGTEKTITLTEGNRSLVGLRDAINQEDMGITATLIQSGDQYKLALIAEESGTEGAITITENLGSISFEQKAAAQNAIVELNGIAVSSSSNTALTAVQGLSINLSKVGTSEVTVSADSAKIASAIESFISAYNGLNSFFSAQYEYNAETKTAGVLSGDFVVRNIQDELQTAVTRTVHGLPDSMNNLASIGVTYNKDGTLSLDSTKLREALDADADGVARLFGVSTTFSDSRVSYVYSNDNTQSGTYAVSGVSWSGGNVSGLLGGIAATGSGGYLTGASGSGAEGLMLEIMSGATGDLGTATVSVGFGEMFRRITSNATYFQTGSIDQALLSLDESTKDIRSSITAMEERLAQKELLLTKQMIDADTALKEMQSKISSLSSQLSALG